VTLTLTLDRVIWQMSCITHRPSIYTPNFIEIGKTFCGRMDVCTFGHFRPPLMLLGRLRGVDLRTSLLFDKACNVSMPSFIYTTETSTACKSKAGQQAGALPVLLAQQLYSTGFPVLYTFSKTLRSLSISTVTNNLSTKTTTITVH